MSQGPSINRIYTAVSNSEPQYSEGQSAPLLQNLNGQLQVSDNAGWALLATLQTILIELRVMNTILQSTLGSKDDLDNLRSSETASQSFN